MMLFVVALIFPFFFMLWLPIITLIYSGLAIVEAISLALVTSACIVDGITKRIGEKRK